MASILACDSPAERSSSGVAASTCSGVGKPATTPCRVRSRCVFSGNSAFTRPVIVAATLPFNC